MTGCRWTVLGKTRSLPKVLQHLDRKCGIGSGLGNFAFPTSLRAREAPRKRCHRSRSSGEPAFGPLSWTSSPRREAASCFFRLSFAGTGEGSHCKTEINTEINTEQGRCCFSVSVSGDSESRWSRWCLRRNPEHLSGQSQPVSSENSFSFSAQTFLFRNLGFVEAKMLIAIIPMHSYRRYWFLTFSAKINLPYVDV